MYAGVDDKICIKKNKNVSERRKVNWEYDIWERMSWEEKTEEIWTKRRKQSRRNHREIKIYTIMQWLKRNKMKNKEKNSKKKNNC